MAAVQCGVFDPATKQAIVPQLSPDPQAEPAGLGVVKSRRFAAGATMPMNEAEFVRSHLPGLLDNIGHRRPDKIAGAITVQVDLGEARLYGVHGHAAPRHAAALGIADRPFGNTQHWAKKNWLGN